MPTPKGDVEVSAVMLLAKVECERLHHNYIGPEHILLALLRLDWTQQVLAELKVNPEKVRNAITFVIGRGSARASPVTRLTPGSKAAVDAAMREAGEGAEFGLPHLLLGVLQAGSVASSALQALGVTEPGLRTAIVVVSAVNGGDR